MQSEPSKCFAIKINGIQLIFIRDPQGSQKLQVALSVNWVTRLASYTYNYFLNAVRYAYN